MVPSKQPASLSTYRALTQFLAPLANALLAVRTRRGKESRERLGERRGVATRARPDGPLIWIHGASVGEVNSVLPLIGELAAARPDIPVLLTSGTVSSANIVAKSAPDSVVHQFVPLDIPEFLERFLDHWRPQTALFVESELWPNTIAAAKKRNIPTILVNARMSARSNRRWRRAPATIRWLLRSFDLCLAQTRADADRLLALGAKEVETVGNLKLDVPAPAAEPQALEALETAVAGRPVFVAASTHPGEEAMLAKAHQDIARNVDGLLTIIAPRHPERGAEIADKIAGLGLACALRSRGDLPAKNTDIYIADTFGELGILYRLGRLVYMGGSLVAHGGQNPIEPAKLGSAILRGPYTFNFTEIFQQLDAGGGSREVNSVSELAELATDLLNNDETCRSMAEGAYAAMEASGGALDRTMTAIEPFLPREGS